jgi:TolB-like protein
LDQAVDRLAAEIDLARFPDQRIVVLPLGQATGGRLSALSVFIAEGLTTRFVRQGKAIILERALTQDILQELKFSESGAVDRTTANRVGRLLGADILVTGTIVELGDLELNVRMINVQTGQVLAASRARVGKSVEVDRLLNQAAATSGVGARPDTPTRPRRYEEDLPYFTLKLTRFQADHGTVEFTIYYKNKTSEPIRLSNPLSALPFNACGDTRLVDALGRTFSCIRGLGQVNNQRGLALTPASNASATYGFQVSNGDVGRAPYSITIPHSVIGLVDQWKESSGNIVRDQMEKMVGGKPQYRWDTLGLYEVRFDNLYPFEQ